MHYMAMAREIYRKVNGEWKWTKVDEAPVVQGSVAIHGDTFDRPLRHPVTGEVIDSGTKWDRINKEHGLECVGNDLLSKKPRHTTDHVTEERIRDSMEQAEAIYSDPAKRREWDNMNQEWTYNHQERLSRK